MCGKKLFGTVSDGLWESLCGCLTPLLSSPSLLMTLSPKTHCGKCAAWASLQRREGAWPQEQTAESPSVSHVGTFGMGKNQSFGFRFFFKKIKRVFRGKKAPFQAALIKPLFYCCWEEEHSEGITLSPLAHSNALAQMP